jgi:hypothetical protein
MRHLAQSVLAITPVVIGLILFAGSGTANGQTAVDQNMPAIAYNSNPDVQNFLLVWIEDRGHGPDIFAKRLFANGLPQGSAEGRGWKVIRDDYVFDRRVPPPGPRADPALVYNATRDEYVLVYSENTGETDGWDVFAVRVSSAGFSQGNPRKLAGGPADQRHPDVALLGGQRGVQLEDYLVVWDDNARDVNEVWAVRLQANGIPRGAPYALVHNASDASDPTTSGSAVAWVDDRNGQSDIFSMPLKNGLPSGKETAVAADVLEEFNPRYGSGGLLWNVFDPATGIDIMGVQVIEDSLAPGHRGPILVPAADQNWPDMESGILVFADNRAGQYDIYAVRVITSGRIRSQGHDYPVVAD